MATVRLRSTYRQTAHPKAFVALEPGEGRDSQHRHTDHRHLRGQQASFQTMVCHISPMQLAVICVDIIHVATHLVV